MTLKIDNAIEEIERALAGNKPKYANDIYLNDAIRYLQEIKSPSLTDDQQEVMEWLQIYADKDSGDKPFQTIFFLWDCIKSNNLGNDELTALRKLTRAEQFQVLASFAEWGMEQEEER